MKTIPLEVAEFVDMICVLEYGKKVKMVLEKY
jgi:hypothetical protein